MKKTTQWAIAIPFLIVVLAIVYLIIPRSKGIVLNKNDQQNTNPSIAVLPFVSMDSNRDQQYFSDGLTEEIQNSLSRVRLKSKR